MKIRKFGNVTIALLLASLAGSVQAQDQDAPAQNIPAPEILVDSSMIDRAMSAIGEKYRESAEVQQELTRLADSASSTFEEFKRANDNLESLLVLNAGFRKSISIQEENIATLDESIASVEEVTRNIPLLMEKMLVALEEFIELDYPFLLEDRRGRIEFARNAIDNPDVSIAEKFRQVLVMYQTETAYGRTIENYDDTIEIDGLERDVNIVRVGRVALIAQTTDRQETRAWDNRSRAWVELAAGEYRTAVQDAIRVAAQLDAPRIIELPVLAPEVAQ